MMESKMADMKVVVMVMTMVAVMVAALVATKGEILAALKAT